MKLTLSVAILFYNFGVYAACLKEGDTIVLSGVMKEELFYGPQNWGKIGNMMKNYSTGSCI
jgi:hypothetical protein